MDLKEFDRRIMADCAPVFASIEETAAINRARVQDAFVKNRVSSAMFAPSTGYGYGDIGRDALDGLLADIVGAEDALCRAAFMSGTHALTVALFGLLRPGMRLLSAVGEPYDTLQTVISKPGVGSLTEFGVECRFVPTAGTRPDLEAIAREAKGADVVLVQRSRGYSLRDTLTLPDIAAVCRAIRAGNPNAVILCDNCYGEFVEADEPLSAGADLIVGSFLKNIGGAIAQTGGYIAGRKEYVALCEHRLTAPGTGRVLGSVPQGHREMFLGLYFAPSVVEQALKSAVYCSRMCELLGYPVVPAYNARRGDIVDAISLGSEEAVTLFCRAIQSLSPIDSFAVPEGYPMPGYGCDVIMASGSFTNGSSIELSCDAPLREPYVLYLQGGIHLDYARRAFLLAAEKLEAAKNR